MMKVTYTHQKEEWSATMSKEYGQDKIVYITASNPRGTQYKSAYSKGKEEFSRYEAGMLDHARAAALALGLIEE